MMPSLLALGAVSLLGQVVLLRELTVAFYGSELIAILGLGLWLAGSGTGALLGRRARVPGAGRLPTAFLAYALVLPAALVLARGIRPLCGGVPGAYLPFGLQLAAMAAILLPPAVLAGAMFQWAAKLAVVQGRSLGAAYAAECAGALAGGAAATLLLACGASNFLAALAGGTAAAAAATLPLRGRPNPVRGPAVAAAALLAIAAADGARLDARSTAWTHPDLLWTRDTPYGRITAEGRSGQTVVFINDALVHDSQGTAAEEFVHPAALQCADPRRVLILGGGLTAVAAEACKHAPALIEQVEISPQLLPAELPATPGTMVRAVVADPRRHLRSARGFDLILGCMPEPGSGADNRYYTREFFAECAGALTPAGVLAFRLPGAENVWTPALARRNAAIQRALTSVFPAVAVLPGACNVFLASLLPLPDAETVAGRLRERSIEAQLVTPDYIRYLYANDRFAEVRRMLAVTPSAMNTDARPACYRLTMALWLARFFPRLAWDRPAAAAAQPMADSPDLWRSPWFWGAAAAWLAAALLSRRRAPAGSFLVMAASAATGMILQAVIILAYQAEAGILYQNLGALLCASMLGMAAGAAGAASLRPSAGRHRPPARARAGAVALCILAPAILALTAAGRLGSLASAAAMSAAVAAAVGAVFAGLGRDAPPQIAAARAPVLLGADLLGGGFGTLAAGLLLVPAWGLTGACAAACALQLGAAAAPDSRPGPSTLDHDRSSAAPRIT